MRLASRPALVVTLLALAACAKEVKQPTATAAAAAASVAAGATVQLDGSASKDPQGLPLAFAWAFAAKPAGSAATLNDAALARPSFVADLPGGYTLTLVVSNGVHASAPASLSVTASACGAAVPVASAGLLLPEARGPFTATAPQAGAIRIPVGSTVVASAAASSDPDNGAGCAAGQALSYAWALEAAPAGFGGALNQAGVVAPSFTASVPGAYRLGLTVTDSTGRTSAAAVLEVTADPSFGAVLPLPGWAIETVNAGAAQAMSGPRGVAVDAAGVIYVAQSGTPRRVTRHAAGTVSILAEGAYLAGALQDLVLDTGGPSPRLVVSQGTPRLVAVDPTTGAQSLFAELNGNQTFRGLAVGSTAVGVQRLLAVDSNAGGVALFDPAATQVQTAASGTFPLGTTLSGPWGVALSDATAAAGPTVFATSGGNGELRRATGGTSSVLLSNTGTLTLDGARDLALTPCSGAGHPKLVVAVGASVLVVDDCAAGPCPYQTLVTGLGNAAGLAFDTSSGSPSLLVTDDATGRQALYRVSGSFCSL